MNPSQNSLPRVGSTGAWASIIEVMKAEAKSSAVRGKERPATGRVWIWSFCTEKEGGPGRSYAGFVDKVPAFKERRPRYVGAFAVIVVRALYLSTVTCPTFSYSGLCTLCSAFS